MRLFSKICFSRKGPLFNFFDILQQIGCLKIPKGPPFQFFGILRLFSKICFSRKGPLFNYFDILQQIGCLKIPKGLPFQFFGILRLFFRKFVFSPKGPSLTATKMTILEVSPFWRATWSIFLLFRFSSTVN